MGKQKGKGLSFLISDRRFIIAALFILAIAVRIIYKNGGFYHWDALRDAMAVEDMLRLGSIQYSYAYGAPGMTVLVFIFYYLDHLITGTMSAEFAYFFATFVTSALCVVFVYLIMEKLTKDRFISISSALFLNFTPIFLSVTTYPKTHSMSLFFALASMYLVMLFNENRKGWMLGLSGFCLGYAVTIRIFEVLYILPILFLYLAPKMQNLSFKISKEKLSIKNIMIFSVPAACIWIALFYNKIMETGGPAVYIKSLFVEQEAAVGWQGFFSSSIIPSMQGIYKTMTLIGVILLFIGLYYSWKKNRDVFIMLLLWIVPQFLYFANIANPQYRFFIGFLPVFMIFMAFGAGMIYKKNSIIGLAAVLIVIGMMFYTVYPLIEFRHGYSGTRETALWVSKMTEPNSVIMSNDFGFFIEYYGNRKTVTHPRSGNDEEINAFMDRLMNYSKNKIPIYSTGEGFAIDPGEKVKNAVIENFDVYLVGEHMNEIYQFSELELRKYNEQLFRFVLKGNMTTKEKVTDG